jgi:hypothetical protein
VLVIHFRASATLSHVHLFIVHIRTDIKVIILTEYLRVFPHSLQTNPAISGLLNVRQVAGFLSHSLRFIIISHTTSLRCLY